jgi:hypothetical protein
METDKKKELKIKRPKLRVESSRSKGQTDRLVNKKSLHAVVLNNIKIQNTIKELPLTLTKEIHYEKLLAIQSVCLDRMQALVETEDRADVVAKVYQIISNTIKEVGGNGSEDEGTNKRNLFFENLADKLTDDKYTDYEIVK